MHSAGDYAKFCGEKYTCALAYRKKLSYIRNLFKNEDYVELEKAFAGYTRMNDRCLKYEEAFETDPEVFDLYLKYLEKTGRISYMEKVKKYSLRSSLQIMLWNFCRKKGSMISLDTREP